MVAPSGIRRLTDAVGVLLRDAEGHAEAGQVTRQHVLGKARLLLIEIHRDELEGDWRAPLQRHQHVEQAVAVLAPGQTTITRFAGLDHGVIADGFAHLALQALGELVASNSALRGSRGDARGPSAMCESGTAIGTGEPFSMARDFTP